MNLLLCELSWQCVILTGWIATMSAVVIVLVCYYLLRYYVQPKQNAKYESKMKEEAFKREKEWQKINNDREDFLRKQNNEREDFLRKQNNEREDFVFYRDKLGKPLAEIKKELDELKNQKKDLDKDTESLKQEKEKFDKKILETKIKAYEEIIKNIKG